MGQRSVAWYRESPKDVAKSVCAVVGTLVSDDSKRLGEYDSYMKLYGAPPRRTYSPLTNSYGNGGSATTATSVGGDAVERMAASGSAPVRLGLFKAAVDTITARVGEIRPRPTFLTNRGDWSLQRKAKDLQLFVDGAYHQSDAYEKASAAFRDGAVLGTGVLLPYTTGTKTPRFCVDRSPAHEWFVDAADAEYGEPRCLYRIRWVSRERVRLYWPNAADAGRDREHASDDFACVIEAWFRPLDAPNQPPSDIEDGLPIERRGRHVLVVEDLAVVDEAYPWDEFPAVFFHWDKPISGFWGPSAGKEVIGIQIEVNKLLAKVQKSMKLVGQPWLLNPRTANIAPTEMTNAVGLRIDYDGNTPPTVVTHPSVSPEIITHMWELWRKGFELLGTNELQATATAPAGMESARGLERLSEQGALRFKRISKAWEFALGEQMAKRFIRLAKIADASVDGGFKLGAPGSRRAIAIRWKDCAMDEDGYLTQVFPTTTLPQEPAARSQEIERMQVAGWIDAEEARGLIELPDLAESNSLATADRDNLARQLEMMLEDGEDVLPEPYQDLDKAILRTQQAILRATGDGCPMANLDRARAFLEAAKVMRDAAAVSAQPQNDVTGAPPAMLPATQTLPTPV